MIGQQLGSFQLEERIGAGAMGIVYRAAHVRNGKKAAVKIITTEAALRGNAFERFEREAEILQQFRHPNIVRFLAVGRSKGTSYFAMEYIDGKTLERTLAERELIDWPEVVDLGLQICQALQYAHERGIVHRDLKPSNLMVTSDGQIKLTDFGIAKDLDATALTADGRTLGTAAYMAPEQIRGTPEVSHKTDLYALGCLLYQMLTHETPFRGSNAMVLMNCHLNQPPPRPSEKTPQIPRVLDDLVVKLLAKSPVDRPWDAEAVATALAELQEKMGRGEPIKMVFGAPYIAPGTMPATQPTLNGNGGESSAAQVFATEVKNRRTTSLRRKKVARKVTGGLWGTLGLAAALVGLTGLVVFLMWPASAEQLYERAKPLMTSSEPSDWKDAERRYLDELTRRFPDNPYKAEIESHRDKILLSDAKGRARILDSPLGKDQNELESFYRQTAKLAAEAEGVHMEDVAARHWRVFANTLEAQKLEGRKGWVMLANERANLLQSAVEKKQADAMALLRQAEEAERLGRKDAADALRRKLIDESQGLAYLADIVARAQAGLAKESEAPASEHDIDSPTNTDSENPDS
jgi:serine/threonine-protein kinase